MAEDRGWLLPGGRVPPGYLYDGMRERFRRYRRGQPVTNLEYEARPRPEPGYVRAAAEGFGADLARSFGAGPAGQDVGRMVAGGAMEFLPLGDIAAGEEAVRDITRGDWLGGGIGLGAALASVLVPGTIGSAARRRRKAKQINVPPGAESSAGTGSSMYDKPWGSDPRYVGAAPDRSTKTFLRYTPRKGASDRVTRSIEALRTKDNPVRHQMLKDIEAGQALQGDSWYNTEELRDWFIEELGEEVGDQEWRDFMTIMGTTSPGSKVEANIANASAVRRRLAESLPMEGSNMTYREALQGVEKLDEGRALARGRPKGYGHKTQGLQELATARWQQGQWEGMPEPGVAPGKGSWTDQPKPKGFTQSLLGNERNIAADLHFTRYMAMASKDPDWLTTQADVSEAFRELVTERNPKAAKYFKKTVRGNGEEYLTFNPKKAAQEGALDLTDEEVMIEPSIWAEKPNDNEYAAFEGFINEIADELDMTPAQVQANLWMGAAQRTGVDDASQGTFMELLRRRADKRAADEGLTREQVIRRFIRENGLLSLLGVGGAAAVAQGSQDES